MELSAEDRAVLERWARGRSLPARQVERARIVLLAAQGIQDIDIAAQLGITNQKASRWRKRFLEAGIDGLKKDATRPGRKPSIPVSTIEAVLLKASSGMLSPRVLAAETGISESTVRRILKGRRPNALNASA